MKGMNKRVWLSTFVALAILMVGLSVHGSAQTYLRRTPFNERYLRANNPLAAAKLAAARVARSKGAMTLRRSTGLGAFLTFDVPGAYAGSTYPQAVSASGIIVGYYYDANDGCCLGHGFVRNLDGTIVTINVPGATDGTYAYAVTDDGLIAGGYGDKLGFHSFIRDRNGNFTTFDAPSQLAYSQVNAINWDGTSTGYGLVSLGGYYVGFAPFLRTPGGKIITFTAPGATFGSTDPVSITPDGRILGVYSVPGGTYDLGFALNPFGGFTEITGPGGLGGLGGAGLTFTGSPSLSSNLFGEIAGTYFQPISGNPSPGGNFRAFLRSPDGKYVTFDAANYSPCCIWSQPTAINDVGTVTGSFTDGYMVNHGFWRTPDGKVTTFDVPAAGTVEYAGTFPMGITDTGVISGAYFDENYGAHGFVFKPNGFGWFDRHR
jgi:hypothetical protein